jgi:hypothetical protein
MTFRSFIVGQFLNLKLVNNTLITVSIIVGLIENDLISCVVSLLLFFLSVYLHETTHFILAKLFNFNNIRLSSVINNLGIEYEALLFTNKDYIKVIITSLVPPILNLIISITFLFIFLFKMDAVYIFVMLINIYFFISSIIAGDDFEIVKDYYRFLNSE